MAADRVYEMRTYTCFEGKLPDLLKRFREHTIEIFNRHHMESVGYWIPQDDRQKTTLIYILAHRSRDAAEGGKLHQGIHSGRNAGHSGEEPTPCSTVA